MGPLATVCHPCPILWPRDNDFGASCPESWLHPSHKRAAYNERWRAQHIKLIHSTAENIEEELRLRWMFFIHANTHLEPHLKKNTESMERFGPAWIWRKSYSSFRLKGQDTPTRLVTMKADGVITSRWLRWGKNMWLNTPKVLQPTVN